MRGKYHKREFRREFESAKQRLAPLGGKVEPGVHDYEAFTYTAPGIRLIFYPHKTTAGHRHIRVREGGKCDPEKVVAAVHALHENTCNFHFPKFKDVHFEAMRKAVSRDNDAYHKRRHGI